MPPSLSVIIPSYNRVDSLLRLLRSIAAQDLPVAEFEVFVVLDGGTDDSAERLRSERWPFALNLIEQQSNRGQAAARNTGIAVATGDVLLFLDDDLELPAGCLSAHLEAHADGVARAVVGKLDQVDAARGYVGDIARWLDTIEEFADAGSGVLPPRVVYTGNLSVPRLAMPAGGFREDLRRLEDTELGYRLFEAGVPLEHSHKARATLYSEKDIHGALTDAAVEGRMMASLWKTDPELVIRLTHGRGRKGKLAVRVIMAMSRLPQPAPIVWVVDALPARLPGARASFRALRMQAYLRGASKELRTVEEWAAYLNRPGELAAPLRRAGDHRST